MSIPNKLNIQVDDYYENEEWLKISIS
jgi:hypothetical protein